MATITDIVTEIQTDVLKRTDLTTLITNQCVRVYRTLCQRVPFEELQVTSAAINCVIGNPIVDLSTLVPALAGICSIKINYSATSAVRLKRSHVRLYDNMPTPLSGRSFKYARWAKKVELWPPPNLVYTLVVRYWQQATIAAIPGDTILLIPDAWQELLLWETMYRLYIVLKQLEDAQALIMGSMIPRQPTSKKVYSQDYGIIPRLWNELLMTISQRENVDEDFSINPLRRG